MYTKQDPYGTIQRWVSDYIEGPWEQIDDRFYASEEALNYNENDLVVCKNIIEDNKHTYRFFNEVIEKNSYLLIPEGKNEKYVFGKHYEGTSIATWGDKKILYSDHYEINNSLEVGNTKTTESVNRVAGIYYSELELNYNNKTNLGYLEDHIRFNIFYKLNTINTEMRPKSSQGNQLRNGWILSLKDVKTFPTPLCNPLSQKPRYILSGLFQKKIPNPLLLSLLNIPKYFLPSSHLNNPIPFIIPFFHSPS